MSGRRCSFTCLRQQLKVFKRSFQSTFLIEKSSILPPWQARNLRILGKKSGRERERDEMNIGTIKTQRFAAIDVHLVRGCQRRCADLRVFGAEVLAKAVLAGLAFSWKVCSACGATLKRRAQDWQLHWVHHKRHASVSCCLCVLEFTKLKLWKTDREQGLVTKRSGYSKALQWLGQSYRYQGIWLGGHMRSSCRQRKMSILANCLLESQSSSK